jgi:hypothetical protein
MCTTFSGAVIRTTHVTGILTDIGLIIGQAIFHKRTRKHLWKLKILVPLYTCFFCGSVIGWFVFGLLHKKAILFPCAIVGCLGLGHICYCKIFLNLKLEKLEDKNEEMYVSTRLSTRVTDTIVQSNTPYDKESSDTDQMDSEEEENILENSTQTWNSLIPLVVIVHDTKVDQDETK